MPYPTNGTIVPICSDSHNLPPNFKDIPQKEPTIPQAPKEALNPTFTDEGPPNPPNFKVTPNRITMFSLHYDLPNISRVAMVLRQNGYSRLYPRITKTSARRLTTLASDLLLSGFCDLSPSPGGWYAHVNRAIYPSPPLTEHDIFFGDEGAADCQMCGDMYLCDNCGGTGKDPIFKDSNCWICGGKCHCTYCCEGVQNV